MPDALCLAASGVAGVSGSYTEPTPDGEGGEYKGLTGKGGSSDLSIFPKDKANGDKLEEAGYVKGDKGGKFRKSSNSSFEQWIDP